MKIKSGTTTTMGHIYNFFTNNTYLVMVVGVIVIVALIGFLSYSSEPAISQPQRQIDYQTLFIDSSFRPDVDFSNKIYDDGKSSAYIAVDRKMEEPQFKHSEIYSLGVEGTMTRNIIIELIVKKNWWQHQFPRKHIISISVVSNSSHSYMVMGGLLIHYETVR